MLLIHGNLVTLPQHTDVIERGLQQAGCDGGVIGCLAPAVFAGRPCGPDLTGDEVLHQFANPWCGCDGRCGAIQSPGALGNHPPSLFKHVHGDIRFGRVESIGEEHPQGFQRIIEQLRRQVAIFKLASRAADILREKGHAPRRERAGQERDDKPEVMLRQLSPRRTAHGCRICLQLPVFLDQPSRCHRGKAFDVFCGQCAAMQRCAVNAR